MKLVRIGWESWDVLAVCDPRGRCQVLDFLEEFERSSPAAAHAMIALLGQTLPQEGPPRSEPLCKSLGNGIYELRKQPKGKKLRVVWFYGVGRVIVCTYAFSKAERTPQIRIEQSRLLRKQYLSAVAKREIEISEEEAWNPTWNPN
jgi:phage-related protein